MLKLKLFSRDKEKQSPKSSPSLNRKAEPVASPKTEAKLKQPTGLKPPTRIITPKKEVPIPIKQREPSQQPVTPEKRCSKSSEEDSAYAGFGSTSPTSSTSPSSSMSLQSGPTQVSATTSQELHDTPNDDQHEKEKPTLAVRGISAPKGQVKPIQNEVPSPVREPSTQSAPVLVRQKSLQSPTVGVVSPMLATRKHQPQAIDPIPSTILQENAEKKKPPVPVRGDSQLEGPILTKANPASPQPEKPRSPPSYEKLVTQGKVVPGRGIAGPSPSDDSLDSISTTIRAVRPPPGSSSRALAREGGGGRPGSSKEPENPASIPEGGIAIYAKMQARWRECRERVNGYYQDSFEDSSSVSSGISENFEDISTDDVSASSLSDHAMTAVTAAYGKLGDYGHFVRSSGKGGIRSSSSAVGERRLHHDQNSIQQLLQQCKTSQRGAACQPQFQQYNTISGVPHLSLSPDGETLSVQARASLRISQKRQDRQGILSNGYHSLDRKYHLGDIYDKGYREGSPHGISHLDQRAAMALVSPRRHPQDQSSHNRHSVSDGHRSTNFIHLILTAKIGCQIGTFEPEISASTPIRRLTAQGSPSHRGLDKNSGDFRGSTNSVASSTAYGSLSERYEAELRKLNRELEGYRQTVNKLAKKHEDYGVMADTVDQRLSHMAQKMEKAQLKPDEVSKLRKEIDQVRSLSARLASEAKKEGAGELLRHPSMESLASHRSSMSSSSKSSKTDKSSLNSFGTKAKKSWIRSSFTKAFTRKKGKNFEDGSPMHQLHPICASNQNLETAGSAAAVIDLKKQLDDKDHVLTDFRLDALDMEREVDVLRETVSRLKNENKQLRADMTRILYTGRSHNSSHSSLMTADDEHLIYEVPPSDRSASGSSKRSSGCGNVSKVVVNVDLSGSIPAAVCPEHEITIGYLGLPDHNQGWEAVDGQIYTMFDDYITRVDPERTLGLSGHDSVIGYSIGKFSREKGAKESSTRPSEIVTSSSTVRLFLRGACQHSVDSLVLESLFPRAMLDQLVKYVVQQRRLVLSGATGLGKSNLARQLCSYLSIRAGKTPDSVVDIRVPEEGKDKLVQAEKDLETALRGQQDAVVLLDNIPKSRISFVSSVFDSLNVPADQGPFIICTINRACQLSEMQMQLQHGFKIFLLTNKMDGVSGFMGRFLRRKSIETEFRQGRPLSPEMAGIVAFFPLVLAAVNDFIERSNSVDMTVGPRLFLQCPLDVDESRAWFVRLWNESLVPYMVKVYREGVKILGRSGTFDDPLDTVSEAWPWAHGPPAEQLLQRLPIKEALAQPMARQAFSPLDALLKLQSRPSMLHENL
ncbi:unnamed protein product, partial [Mesorhabditis spiculigera]